MYESNNESNVLKMFEVLAAFQRLSEPPRTPEENERSEPCPGMEERLNTPELATIKAAIPYLAPIHQKYMNVLVKLIEIQRLMEFYRETAEAVSARGFEGDGWKLKMLEYIRPYLIPANQQRVDTFVKFMEVYDMIVKMRQ